MYKAGLPINTPITDESSYYGSFEAEFHNFWTNGSYYCIFAGLGFLPEHPLPLINYKTNSITQADQLLADVKQQQRELLSSLPTNYDFLRRLHRQD
jgi:tryptophan halogenase